MVIPAGLLGVILLLPPGSTYLTMMLLILCNVIQVVGVSGGEMLPRVMATAAAGETIEHLVSYSPRTTRFVLH